MKYDKIFLIGNPIAGGGALKKIQKAEAILKKKGIPFETLLTKQKGDGELFAKRIRENNNKVLIIGCGGDGTYNEIINGLAHSQIPLAILPMGTTSVLAMELKIPRNLEKAVDFAIHGKIERIHLGKIKSRDSQRFFILMAGIGFDGLAVYNVEVKKKIYLKKIAYILSGIKTLFKYKPKELKIQNGIQRKAYSIVVSKSACYGGNFKISPDASLKEPIFSVFLSKTKSKLGFLFQIFGIILRKHLKMKKIEFLRGESFKITGDAHVQIDGDYFGKTPVEIKIVKNALSLVFPE